MSANISLYAALRTPRVDTGLAANAQSVQRLEQDSIIAPARFPYDLYGREAVISSLNGYTYGMDPLQQIVQENAIRNPQYGYYLNVPQGIQGVGQDTKTLTPKLFMDSQEKDTLGVNRYQYFGFSPTYKLDSEMRPQYSNMNKQDRDFLAEQTRLERIMNRTNVSPYYSVTY